LSKSLVPIITCENIFSPSCCSRDSFVAPTLYPIRYDMRQT
jgi:hypothetical protein